MDECYFFGCWNRAGHYLHLPGGHSPRDESLCYYGPVDPTKPPGEGRRTHLDGTLAPRKHKHTHALCWQGQGKTSDDRERIGYDSEEYPQGQFLVHHLDSGFTAMQWWDRCQGDTRGACNSTLLAKGERTADQMLALLRLAFPHVVENLKHHDVELVEVHR